MPTPAERQALLFFAAVAALGIGVNAWRAARGGERIVAGSASDLATQIARVDSAVARSPSREMGRAALRKRNAEKKAHQAKPAPAAASSALSPPILYPPPLTDSRIDLDAAAAAAIESLPRIGPALAGRIVANRDSFGAFGSLDGLQRVRGIGPGLAKAISGRVTFSGVPRATVTPGTEKHPRRSKVP